MDAVETAALLAIVREAGEHGLDELRLAAARRLKQLDKELEKARKDAQAVRA